MEKQLHILTILFVFALPLYVQGYAAETTHAGLSKETVSFFNLSFPGQAIDEEGSALIIKGSVLEDDPLARVVFHFYDPIYGDGLKSVFQSAKEWANDVQGQGNFRFWTRTDRKFSSASDYSWDRAIYEYTWGDRERGLEGLGHILHLIQDMAVPDHTRNDDHLTISLGLPAIDNHDDRSPYESWASRFTPDNIDVVSKIKQKKLPLFDSLEKYFDRVAYFSNTNFFSKDTIETLDYSSPVLKGERVTKTSPNGKERTYLQSNIGEKNYLLIQTEKKLDLKEIYSLTDPDGLIFADYWSLLSQEAVLNGAGVIKLFFDEVEKERQTKRLKLENRSQAEKFFEEQGKKIFDISKALYGSSVNFEDVQSEAAVIASQNKGKKIWDIVSPEFTQELIASLPKFAAPLIEEEMEEKTAQMQRAVVEERVEPEEQHQPNLESPPEQIPNPGISGLGLGGEIPPSSSSEEGSGSSISVSVSSPQCEENSIGISDCIVVSSSLTFEWTVSGAEAVSYTLSKNGTYEITAATSTSVTATDGAMYVFEISALDGEGNRSATTTLSVGVYPTPVVINEVAWGGTTDSSSSQWIELLNRTSSAIDVTNFVLFTSSLYIPLSGSIPANGYYLIEKDSDSTVSTSAADLISTFPNSGGGFGLGGGMPNLGIRMSSGTTTIDQVAQCGSTYCGGTSSSNPSGPQTVERYSASVSGSDTANWSTAIDEFIKNGSDAGGNPIKGTPKAKNGISYLIDLDGTLSSSKTLTQSGSPYLVGRGGLTVSSGATLTLESGTVVKIVSPESPSIAVNGTLHAEGDFSNPVVFTAFEDDNYGGDLNADGACGSGGASCPVAGNWKQILFSSSSSGSELIHTIVRYGGAWFTNMSTERRGMVVAEGTDITIENSTFAHSKKHGLILDESGGTVSNSTFDSNATDSDASGLYVFDGTAVIQNSTFSNNRYGVKMASAGNVELSNGTFTGNSSGAGVLSGVVGSLSGNSGTNNSPNAFIYEAGTIANSSHGTTTLRSNSLPYLLSGESFIASGGALAFENGVVIKGYNNAGGGPGKLTVQSGGLMYANGSSPNDVVFTSIFDSTVGGETTSGTPASGDWKGLSVLSGGSLSLSGFTLKYAGWGFQGDGSDRNGIRIEAEGTTTIRNALLSDNRQAGIRVATGNLSMSNSTITNHTSTVSGSAAGIYVIEPASATLDSITFSANTVDIGGLGSVSVTCTNCGTPVTSPSDLLD